MNAAARILSRGGNAIDAAMATHLVQCVRGIGTTCIGGEAAALVYLADQKRVVAIAGQGAAPLRSSAIDWYLDNPIPKGSIRSAAVPAMLDFIVQSLRAYGTLTFEEVAEPALAALEEGGDNWYRDTALGRTILCATTGREVANWRLKLARRRLPPLDWGRNWRDGLLETFRRLIEAERSGAGDRSERLQAVSDRFYRGDIAETLCTWYAQQGGFLEAADLAQHRTYFEEPRSVEYRGFRVCKCDTWTQGPSLLQALRLLEGWNLRDLPFLGADHIHIVSEAMKLALADRDEHYGDPLLVDVPMDALLSDAYTELRRDLIEMKTASKQRCPGDPVAMRPRRPVTGVTTPAANGTTTCVVADRWGNVVVSTPSGVGSMAGSGGSTGVTHGGRLTSLNRWRGHPNCFASGKRPRITLSPTLVLRDEVPMLGVSIPSGDLQDQLALQIVTDLIDFERDPESCVEIPPFFTHHLESSFHRSQPELGSLKLSSEIDRETWSALASRGHDVSELRAKPGGIGMIVRDNTHGGYRCIGNAPQCVA